MSGIFGLDWEPVTSSSGFIQAPIDKVTRAFLNWNEEIFAGHEVQFQTQQVSGQIEEVLMNLSPLTSPLPTKYLFIPTASPWTAFVDNGWRGTDPVSAMSVLAEKLACAAMRVTYVEHTMPSKVTKDTLGEYGATILEVYAADGSCRRTIYAANDGGKWKFGQSGEPYPFENLTLYTAKKVRNRFKLETLIEYLAKLGLSPFDRSWFLPPHNPTATLVTKIGATMFDHKEYPLSPFS